MPHFYATWTFIINNKPHLTDSITKQLNPLYIFTHRFTNSNVLPIYVQLRLPRHIFPGLADENFVHFSFPPCLLYMSDLCHPSFGHRNNTGQTAGLQIMKLLILLFLPLCRTFIPCSPNIFMHSAKSKQSDKLPSAYTDITNVNKNYTLFFVPYGIYKKLKPDCNTFQIVNESNRWTTVGESKSFTWMNIHHLPK